MLPPFDLQGGGGLVAARALTVSALLSAFGTLVFRTLVAPKAFTRMPPALVAAAKRQCLLLARLSVGAAALGICIWLVVQTANIADADSMEAAFAAVPAVLLKTTYGHVIVLQSAALLVLALLLGWREAGLRPRAALAAAAVVLCLQAGHSHAFSMTQGPSVLLGFDILHLLGAGGWLGGLVPLLLVVRMAEPRAGATAARWFSPLGQWCIVALVVSAAFQGWILVASIPGLIGTAYGWLVLVKLALFGVLFGFAWANRYHFAPALLRESPESAKRVLVLSILVQTGFGVAIVIAAVVLSDLPPAMHLQALWPFKQQFSLAAVREDADIRREVVQAALALAGAAMLVAAAILARRLRLAAAFVAALAAWFAWPHFDVLFVPAYPTSFYHSPTGFTSATIVDGGTVFAQNCVSCHGGNGSGDGPAAKTLALPPADLTASHLWMHGDGELFWWISQGMRAPGGAPVMPGFAGTLDEDSRWAVIDYIRAHNAGTAHQATGAWPHIIHAPEFGLRCGANALRLGDLRGRFVRLVFGRVPPVFVSKDVVTIIAGLPDGEVPAPLCVTRDATVLPAYAIVSGMAQSAMAGAEFLIDADGWLRAQSGAPSWDDPKLLNAAVLQLRQQKVAAPANDSSEMKMPM